MTPRLLSQPSSSTRARHAGPSRARTFALAFFLTLLVLLLWGAMRDTAHGEDAPADAGEAPAAETTEEAAEGTPAEPVAAASEPEPVVAEPVVAEPVVAEPVVVVADPVVAEPEATPAWVAYADEADADVVPPVPPAPARAAAADLDEAVVVTAATHTPPAVHQCNADTYPTSAGWEASCVVTVENTLGSDGSTQSRVTTTWCLAEAGVLPPEGCTTDVTTSNQLVTSVDQCNGILAGGSNVTCRVEVVNNVPAGTPTSGVTVNQCIGSGQGGVSPDGPPTDCDPVDSSTSGATVTQCNGSANGGGGPERVQCSVAGAATALPVTVNQCNGSTAAGSTVTCTVSYTNNFAAAAVIPTPTATPTPTAVPATRSTPVASDLGQNESFTPGDSSASTARSTTGPSPFGGTATSLAATGATTSTPRLLTAAALLLLLGGLLLAGARRRQVV